MSAIGDYIHFGRIGYNEHGITRDGKKDSTDYFKMQKKIMRNRAKMLASGINKKDKQKYEAHLNNIFSTYNEDDGSMYKIAQDIIKNKLDQDFMDALGDIDWSTGDVKKIYSSKYDISKIQIRGKQKEVFLSTLLKRVRKLEDIKSKLRNSKKITDLDTQINKIYDELSQITNIAKKELQKNGLNINEFNQKLEVEKGKNSQSLANQTYNLITTINKTISMLTPPVYLQKGNLFEYGAALAGVMANGIAEDNIKETLQKGLLGVQGDKRSPTKIDFKKFFMDGITENMYMNKWNIDFDNETAVSFMPSQEKIDILVTLGGKPVGISAKNYNFNLGYNLQLLSGSSLLYLIQDENTNFVNHYLNLVAQHPKSSISLSGNFNAAHEAMKFTILYKAFSGDTYGREKASLFLVNDNSKPGGVKLYEMSDLIDKAYRNIEAYAIFKNLPAYESVKNRWKNTPEERIASFLSEIHKYKISVSLSPSILKK